MSTLSDEEIYKEVAAIIGKFRIFQCIECVNAVKKWLKRNKVSGTILKITPLGRGSFIVSERWDGSNQSITQNRVHYGVEVRGKVFDNLSTVGLARMNWVRDFSCPSGDFNIEEVENF